MIINFNKWYTTSKLVATDRPTYRPTDLPTDIVLHRAAIAAKNWYICEEYN